MPQAIRISNHLAQPGLMDGSNTSITDILDTEPQIYSGLANRNTIPITKVTLHPDAHHSRLKMPSTEPSKIHSTTGTQAGEHPIPSTRTSNVTEHWSPQLRPDLSEHLLQYEEYPDLTAAGEEWAFQGVDMAFFDSIMRSTIDERNEDAERIRPVAP